LQKYVEAAKTLDAALGAISENRAASYQKALIYIHYAWLYRSQRKFSESFNYSKKAISAAPSDQNILAAYYLNIGRSLFASGYDISAIVWLEKAEKLLDAENVSSDKIETFRFLSLAWWSKLDYQNALKYAEQCVSLAEQSRFKYKHRRALFDLQTILSESGQERRAAQILARGLKLSEAENDSYQASIFLSSLLLHALDLNDETHASGYLNRLEKIDEKRQFTFEIKLGQAVIAAFQNQPEISDRIFAEIENEEKPSNYTPLYWKLVIAERNQDWVRFIKINQELLDLTTKDNFSSGLPKIHLNFARAYFHLNQPRPSVEHLEKSLQYIEEIRKSENHDLSLSLLENYHDAYRLLAQIKSENAQESFGLADFLKARLLRDRITNAAIKTRFSISPSVRKMLEDSSLKYFSDPSLTTEIEKNEKFVTNSTPDLNLSKPDLSTLDRIPNLNNTAIISYFFTLDKRLMAFVWEKNKPLKSIYLPVSEDEIESAAKEVHLKIKNFIFFKRDGKDLFDKLLKPLSLSAKHFVIVPDKHLWKIPFQALSPDGEKYLIEDKLVSYVPSVSILLDQLKNPKPTRRTIQVFANQSYDNQFLQYVNAEAVNVAGLFNSRPVLNATVADFQRLSDHADTLHFSMHAQVDNDQPLDSFLGSKQSGRTTAV
jgi:tetratricopeptide (TPR) repeat protein